MSLGGGHTHEEVEDFIKVQCTELEDKNPALYVKPVLTIYGNDKLYIDHPLINNPDYEFILSNKSRRKATTHNLSATRGWLPARNVWKIYSGEKDGATADIPVFAFDAETNLDDLTDYIRDWYMVRYDLDGSLPKDEECLIFGNLCLDPRFHTTSNPADSVLRHIWGISVRKKGECKLGGTAKILQTISYTRDSRGDISVDTTYSIK